MVYIKTILPGELTVVDEQAEGVLDDDVLGPAVDLLRQVLHHRVEHEGLVGLDRVVVHPRHLEVVLLEGAVQVLRTRGSENTKEDTPQGEAH